MSRVSVPADATQPVVAWRTRLRAAAPVFALVALCFALYHATSDAPFYYSENAGIRNNPVVQELELFWTRMLTPKGFFQRPLSVLSYAFNYAVGGENTSSYHWVNIALHAANTVLVFLLAQRFFRAAWLAALLFAVHPLATACAAQIFGRNYSLATLFMNLALLFYFGKRSTGTRGRGENNGALEAQRTNPGFFHWRGRDKWILGLLFLAMLMSKQSFVIFPVLLLWYELGRSQHRLSSTLRSFWASPVLAGVALITLCAAAAFLFHYALPLSRTSPIPPETFLISQFGNSLAWLRFYFLPFQTSLLHDLYLYDDLLHWEVWFGVLLVAGLVATALRFRATAWGFLIGAFLLSVLPTNSVLPKNEIIREWRFYPSLVFFSLLTAYAVAAAETFLKEKWGRPRRLRAGFAAALTAYLGVQSLSVWRQNQIFRDPFATWKQILDIYPYSADAMNNLGHVHAEAGHYETALGYFLQAIEAGPESYIYYYNTASAYSRLEQPGKAATYLRRAELAQQRYGDKTITFYYK